jgi:hypothetical protein
VCCTVRALVCVHTCVCVHVCMECVSVPVRECVSVCVSEWVAQRESLVMYICVSLHLFVACSDKEVHISGFSLP